MPNSTFAVGIVLISLGLFAFLVSHIVASKLPAMLLGSLTMLWFRCLSWIIIGGLVLLVLESVNRLLFTFLFWRH